MKNKIFFVLFISQTLLLSAQVFQGTVLDSKTTLPIAGVEVFLVEDNVKKITNNAGTFSLKATTNSAKTLTAELGEIENYMFFEENIKAAQSNITIALRPKIKSAATLRWENYMGSNGTGIYWG